jgi:hypothetical protein
MTQDEKLKLADRLRAILRPVDSNFARRGMSVTDDEQWACLLDPERAYEAEDMVDDWEARCSLPATMRATLSEFIRDNAMAALTSELNGYCDREGLPRMCALELSMEPGISATQKEWLLAYTERWDDSQKIGARK